ncbi:MAG: DNA-processing protein DprA [Desulfobacteraceae bacterium]|nr:DNA-processing protein DprA [Desulfobacteraceae bacterium]
MEHVASWLTLKSIPGIGNILFMRLVSHFGTPDQVLSAPARDLRQVVSPSLADTISAYCPPEWIEREIEQTSRKGFRIITIQSALYPDLLRHIPDPPPVLYVYGRLQELPFPIAVVGSRNATTYGRNVTHRLCSQLAQKGATVVSGLARGIDTAAHEGALAGGGRTVAVLGSGLDHPYPLENLKLFHQIAENGCVLSEFPLSAEPEPHHFPMRNRIISGMSLGTVVAEAARKSGSLITARLAIEQNREVFAVPGSIHADTAKGTHDLIKQGAKLVENADDIIEEIAPQLAGTTPPESEVKPLPSLSDQERTVFAIMEAYPQHIDALAGKLKMEMGLLTSTLFQLELKGAIRQEPGKFFVSDENFAKTGLQ